MKYYYFYALDQQGKTQKGKILAESETSAAEYLRNYGLTLIKLKEEKLNFLTSIFKFLGVISFKDKIFLYRNLSLILKSGANLTYGLRVLSKSLIKYSTLKEFIIFLIYYIERGGHLYEAFEYYKKSFSPIEIEIIKVGEISGNLVKTFDKLAEDLNKEKQIRSEIISSLIYPSIILGASFLVIILVTTFVMPRLANLVIQMETELPFYSQIILNTGLFIGRNIKLILFFLLLIFLSLFILFFSKIGRLFILKISLQLPIIKKIILYLNLRSFCFVLESLLKSGIPLSKAIYLTNFVINHPQMHEAIVRLNKKIEQGYSFAESINQEYVFPAFFTGVLGIASETGNLTEVLTILQGYYEDELKFYIKNLMTLIEPILIIFVGLIVGLIAISIVVPIYQQISTQIEKGLQQRP